VPRSSRNHRIDRECLIVQQAATSCLCIVICWDKPSRFATTILCVSSRWVFIVAYSKRDLQFFVSRLKEKCIGVNFGINSGKLHQKRKIFSKPFCDHAVEERGLVSGSLNSNGGKTVWTLWVFRLSPHRPHRRIVVQKFLKNCQKTEALFRKSLAGLASCVKNNRAF